MRIPLLSVLIGIAVPALAVSPQQEPLIQNNNLTYLGAFRLPDTTIPNSTYGFSYAVTGIAFNPANNSLFLNTHAYEQRTAEVSIPALSTNMNSVQTATLLQNPADITEGNLNHLLAGGAPELSTVYMGGLLVYNNKLVGTSYIYYDAAQQAALSHFTHSLTLSQTGSFRGMYKVGSLNPGFYAGSMALIPPQWQSLLGGPVLTGLASVSIIGRTSSGPSAFVMDPDQLGVVNPVPATPLVYYDLAHETLGAWSNTTTINLYNNQATNVRGVVFPVGTRTVLFFGRQGTSVPCYGEGGATPPPGAVHWCYDPANDSKGPHAYPYKFWVWAYDANDLLTVKNGQNNPWDIRPYAIWELPIPLAIEYKETIGAAYDPATQRIFVGQASAGGLLPGAGTYDRSAVIHVFQVNNSPPPTLSPCDANKDGSTNIVDVQVCANMAIGNTSCTADINLDGQCTIVDVQRVIVAALGGACVSP